MTETPQKAETIGFSAEISKVLKLMIHSLYTNKDIFLRELISNASDACDKLRYQSLTTPLGDEAKLKITLQANKAAKTLVISDNGIGMSREELVANLGTIARSGTAEFSQALTGDAKKDMPLIGQFGVGFYSAFMVADKVVVKSRKFGEAQGWQWESNGEGEFSVSAAEDAPQRGTEITLHLRKDSLDYADRHRISHIVETYSDHVSFPIELLDEKGEARQLNKAAALWARPKSEITPEQYQEFYRAVSHQPDEPFLTLHNQMEGKTSYTNLLYIPSMRPFDLYHPERKRRVKLYVKRVFITDEGINLVPQYLRFLRGVIDSEDLPLNISRETLQHNPQLDKIRESITKKVLSELKKKAEKEPEAYSAFWKNFGGALKEGLCESIAPKEKILEICRFAESNGQGVEATLSLDEYVAQMKEGQDAVYYLLGDKVESLRNHPQLEGFRKHGVNVLLLTDQVDDFWVNVVQDYKGTPLKSVTKAGADLDKWAGPEEKVETSEAQEDVAELITRLQAIYGEEVREVRTTHKLAESPVCLAVGEGEMDIRMERFLRENNQLPNTTYAKILEINPQHPVIQGLAAQAKAGNLSEDFAWLLLDQARIIEGEEIADPAAFSRRLTQLLQGRLAA